MADRARAAADHADDRRRASAPRTSPSATGAVWTANYVDGTVSRIDPRTNTVTASIPVGAAQALAAGAGSAWVSVAGGTDDGALPAVELQRGRLGRPQAGRADRVRPRAARAPSAPTSARWPTRSASCSSDHGFRAGSFTVGYQSCDDSTAQSGEFEQRRCAANANAYARAEHARGGDRPRPLVLRPGGDPDPQPGAREGRWRCQPVDHVPEPDPRRPARAAPAVGRSGEPEVYYPTGERNFVRVIVARQDLQGVALAMLAKQLGLRRVYLLHDAPDGIGNVVWTDPFRRAAARLGVGIAGDGAPRRRTDYAALADTVARSGADGVLIGTVARDGGLLKALRARLGRRATIMAGDGFAYIPDAAQRRRPRGPRHVRGGDRWSPRTRST